MGRTRLFYKNQAFYREKYPYKMVHWSEYDFSELNHIMAFKRTSSKDKNTYNDVFIMADTETSKKRPDTVKKVFNKKKQITQTQYIGYDNHVCAWSIALRAYDTNIVTLWGHRPDTMMECIEKIHNAMPGDTTLIYFHNYPYDYIFLRLFMYDRFGFPTDALNVKPHYPINMKFSNGIVFRDSLILAQRSLERWASDLDTEHGKAVGKWQYDKLRNQDEKYDADELLYIENDVLAGVECLNKMADGLHKRVYTLPFTATGIPREEVRKRGKKAHAHADFLKCAPTFEFYQILEQVYHGGFTHANRHFIEDIWPATCYDLASSYPFQLLTMKAPHGKFNKLDKNCSIQYIMDSSDKFAFVFRLILYNFRLKDSYFGMPPMQLSKTVKTINVSADNGRCLCGGYAELWLNEVDLKLIEKYYQYEKHICTDVYFSYKKPLPKWYKDYVYQCFYDKTMLKPYVDEDGVKHCDKVAYALAKSRLNSIYGMAAQKSCKPFLIEDYETGEYKIDESKTLEETYNKFVNNYESVLPYVYGIWCTSEAMVRLFELGECVAKDGYWLYSDTDSCYCTKWDLDKLNAYNEESIRRVREAGYEAVVYRGREYWPGVAESDPDEDEHPAFVSCGAKRYACTDKDGNVHITVAGVPKKNGAKCLKNDIKNFKAGLVFDGVTSGKKLHTYYITNKIYTDKNGNLTGDSVNLSPCDYLLDSVNTFDWEALFNEQIQGIVVYDEENYD